MNTVILVIILAVFYDISLYLIGIVAFLLHGRLAPGEQIYMEALPGQNLPRGFINYVIGSLYGHTAAAYRAKEKLHATLTRGGMSIQSKFDNCLYCLVHPLRSSGCR